MILYLLNLADLALTLHALSHGGVELNPLMRNPAVMVAWKVVGVGVLCWWLPRVDKPVARRGLRLCACAFALYFFSIIFTTFLEVLNMAIYVVEQVYLPDHLNPNGYPVVKPFTLTRHKGDPWPLKADAPFLTNFSQSWEMDTGTIYLYDAAYNCWRDKKGNIVSNVT